MNSGGLKSRIGRSEEFVLIPLSPPVGVPDCWLVLYQRAATDGGVGRAGVRERETERKTSTGEFVEWGGCVRGREGERQRQQENAHGQERAWVQADKA